MKQQKDSKTALLALPFDQYSRQKLVQQIIDKSIRGRTKKLSIIDLGGHKGHTKDFFPNDEITILDVFDESYPGYIKGDATDMKFDDGTFDVAVSFDTYEHIPKQNRRDFMSEAARITRRCFIVAAPFNTQRHTTLAAEKLANELYLANKSVEHPWLKEHIEYGTPDIKETDVLLEKLGLSYVRIPTNSIDLWLLTQGLMFNAATFDWDVKEVVDANTFYNTHIQYLDQRASDSYRQVYIVSRDAKNIEDIKKHLPSMSSGNAQKDATILLEYLSVINKAYGAMLTRLHEDVSYLQEREKHLLEEYEKLAYMHESDKPEALSSRLRNKLRHKKPS